MAPAAAVKAGVSGITTPSGSHVSSVIEIASDPVKKDVIKKSGEGDVVSAAPSVTATLARDNDAGVFATKETIADQMTRLRLERSTNPAKTKRTMKRGQHMVQLATEGQLRDLISVVSQCPREEILTWFTVRMFKAACLQSRLQIMRFMVDRGFDVGFNALSEALHWAIQGSAAESNGQDIVPALKFLAEEAGMSPNFQRASDFRTPLHLAVERGLFDAAQCLIELGADVNAIAKDDVMPLSLAEETITAFSPPPSVPTPAATPSSDCCIPFMSLVIHEDGGGQRQQNDEQQRKGKGLLSSLFSSITVSQSNTDCLDAASRVASQEEKRHPQQQQSQVAEEKELLHLVASRARICGLLVGRGARRTWRREPSAKQVSLDGKLAALMAHDARRTFCTSNG